MNLRVLRTLVGRHKRLLHIVVGLSLVTVLILKYDPAELAHNLAGAPLLYIIPWQIFHNLALDVMGGLGLYCLVRRHGKGSPRPFILSSFKLHVISVVVPGRLGDLSLLHFMRDRYPRGQLLAAMVVDKFITLALSLTLAAIGVWIFYGWIYGVALLGIMVMGLLMLLALASGRSARLRHMASEVLRRRLGVSLDGFQRELAQTLRHPGPLLVNFLLTAARAALSGLSYTLVLLWFGGSVHYLILVPVQAMAQVCAFIPVSFMGLGIVEGVTVELLKQENLAESLTLSASLAFRVVELMLVALLYLIWLRHILKAKPGPQPPVVA